MKMKKVVPFRKARETSLYGSKAVGLGDAVRQGLPVPPGVALSGDLVEALASGEDKAFEQLEKAVAVLPPPFAVRSSAVDEDGAAASFAGQHLTLLNVHSASDVFGAVREVWWSANSDSAITYRQRVGLFTRPSVGVVVQSLLNPTAAGVMFTENPLTGADERMIEASWGLGEAVVSGLVVPDHFRIDRAGQVLERDSGQASVSCKGTAVATLGPGDYFGEIALIDGGARSATVTATTDLVCYGLTFWEFRPLIERNSGIAWKLLQALAKRLRASQGK
jgi:pyruvate,water dikinase